MANYTLTRTGAQVEAIHNKVDGIESGATADQTGAEIKISYEGEADTNAYTDAEKTKLAGIEALAEANNISDANATDLTDGGDTALHDHDGITENTAARHTQGTDTTLGALSTKTPPIDADKAIYRDSTDSDALVTSTWTQVKAYLKTYFDTLYAGISNVGFTVQRGTKVLAAGTASDTITITEVDTGKAYLITSARIDVDAIDRLPNCVLTNGTTITCTRENATGAEATIYWQVVESN